jgi:hypothetical protein
MDDVTVDGWVWPSTVHTMMALLSSFIGYEFGDSDWDAVRLGLEGTDADRSDGFYEYPLVGALCSRCASPATSVPIPWR